MPPVLYKDRAQAGELLAAELARRRPKDPIVLGIPRGGVPVGEPAAKALDCPLDVIVLRKIPIPWSPEAGFGAVTLDKTVVLNERLVSQERITRAMIEEGVKEVYKEVLRRDRVYRGGRPFPALKGKTAVIVDDGLASGFTMLAAVKYAKSRGASRVVVASPVSSDTAYALLEPKCDELVALHVDHGLWFAVASFYERFPDMDDSEVIEILERCKWKQRT